MRAWHRFELLEERRLLHGAGPDTATPIELGTASGEFAHELDEGWYVFSAKANTPYLVEIPEQGVRVTDENGLVIGPYFLEGQYPDAKVFEVPTDQDVYFVSWLNFPISFNYELSVSLFQDDHGNAYPSATLIQQNEISGKLEHRADRDVFRFSGKASEEYVFRIPADPNHFTLSLAQGDTLVAGTGSQQDFVTWTPEADQDVFVIVEGTLNGVLPEYVLEIVGATEFDQVGDTAGTAVQLELGETFSDTIDSDSDRDWFRVSGAVGDAFYVDLQPATSHPTIVAYDGGLNTISSNTDFPFVFRKLDEQDFYLEVNRGTSFSSQFPYDLAVYRVTEGGADAAAGLLPENEIPVGGAVAGASDGSDLEDWFHFNALAGRSYEVNATLGEVQLRDGGGTLLPGASVTVADDTRILVQATATDSRLSYYQLSVREVPDDHADNLENATVFEQRSMSGQLSEGDVDWFVFTPAAGTTYRFDAREHSVSLWNRAGEQIDDEVGGFVLWTADSQEDVFVRVNDDTNQQVVDYWLHIEDLELLDREGTSASTAIITELGRASTGQIDVPGDVDWFYTTVQPGVNYAVSVSGASDLKVYTENAETLLVETMTDGENVQFISPTQQNVVFRVTGDTYDQRYSIAVNEFSDDHADSPEGATLIQGTTFGEIELVGDVDYFVFPAQEGTQVSFSLLGIVSRNTEWRVLNAELVEVVDSSASPREFSFSVQQSGTYYVEVAGKDFAIGSYQLESQVIPNADFDHPNTAGQAWRMPRASNGAVGILEPGDQDWFVFQVEADTSYVFWTTVEGVDLRLYSRVDGQALVESPLINVTFSDSRDIWFEVSGNETDTALGYGLGILTYDDDHGESRWNATEIPDISVQQTGVFNVFGDIDAFLFEPVPGLRYTVSIDDAFGALFLRNGRDKSIGNASGTQTIEFDVPRSEPVLLLAQRTIISADPMPYTIRITSEPVGPDDHGDSPLDATPMRRGEVIGGNVPLTTDSDFFAFQAFKGERITASVLFQDQVTNNLQITDEDGKTLALTFASEPFVWQAPESGTYYFEVLGFDSSQDVNLLGDYELGIDFDMDVIDRVCSLIQDGEFDDNLIDDLDFVEDGRLDHRDVDFLVRETFRTKAGDANLDGKVNFTDFLVLSANFGSTHARWSDGDFNCSGEVGFDDFLALSRNFGE